MQQIKDKLKGIGLQEACKGIVKQINSPTIVLVVIVAVIVGILMFYLVRKYATQ